ncbi:MAG: VOC family protein [Salinivirgaceae bacterium]|nr:VOC family protein [Salinivirgaceae bacterium]
MELSNVRLLVQDFDACFTFYSEKLNLIVDWGKLGDDYASFNVGMPMGLSIYKTDLMAKAIGNSHKNLPLDSREKSLIILKVKNVDKAYERLLKNGVAFISEPKNMSGWGMRVAHLYDPENNLIEIWSELAKEKWDKDLLTQAKDYE